MVRVRIFVANISILICILCPKDIFSQSLFLDKETAFGYSMSYGTNGNNSFLGHQFSLSVRGVSDLTFAVTKNLTFSDSENVLSGSLTIFGNKKRRKFFPAATVSLASLDGTMGAAFGLSLFLQNSKLRKNAGSQLIIESGASFVIVGTNAKPVFHLGLNFGFKVKQFA